MAAASPVVPGETALRAQALRVCPEQGRYPCVDQYVVAASGSVKVAFCTTPQGQWFFEPPRGAIGDPCSRSGARIVTIVGGE